MFKLSYSERETEEFAFDLAKQNKISFGDIIALRGGLGAGKTAFTRGLAGFFSSGLRVTSPTFALVNEYAIDINKKILHFDMYRINSEDDLHSIGFYDYLDDLHNKIIIIEWFENIADFFDENTADIEILKSWGDDFGAPSETKNENANANENARKIIFERRLKC